MTPHAAIAREYSPADRLARFANRYYLLLVVAIVLLVFLVAALCGAFPDRVPQELLIRDLLAYRPLLLAVGVPLALTALLLPWCTDSRTHGDRKPERDYRHYLIPLLCFGAGYANLLLGVSDSLLGVQASFLVGMLIDNHWKGEINSLRTLHERRLTPLAFCTALYVLYTALVVVGWSTDKALALTYWRSEVWLLVVPLYFLIYRGPSERLAQSFWLGALRIGWGYLILFFAFHSRVLISCGVSPFLPFTFDKHCMLEAGFIINGNDLLTPFLHTHYTYLGLYLLIPVVMTICSRHRLTRHTARWVLLGIALYACILQARYVLLMTLVVGGYALIYGLLRWLKGLELKRDVAAYLVLAGAILLTLIYTTSPGLTEGYFDGGVRNIALQIGYDALREVPRLIGGGLDYGHRLLQTFPMDTPGEPYIYHFHNQYLQSLVQSGVIGLLLWIAILGAMLWIARRQRDGRLIVVTALWIILCNVDLVSYLATYLIGMLLILCFAMGTREDLKINSYGGQVSKLR